MLVLVLVVPVVVPVVVLVVALLPLLPLLPLLLPVRVLLPFLRQRRWRQQEAQWARIRCDRNNESD